MEYIEIQDGRVVGHFSAKMVPNGEQYQGVTNFTGMIGTPVSQLDSNGKLLSKDEIKAAGILTPGENETIVFEQFEFLIKPDYRESDYWDLETGEKIVFKIGDTPDESMTDIDPGDIDATWDGSEWIVPVSVLESRVRRKRDILLFETDYILLTDYPCSNKSAFITYRQKLRDIPNQSGFPESIQWPERPEVIV